MVQWRYVWDKLQVLVFDLTLVIWTSKKVHGAPTGGLWPLVHVWMHLACLGWPPCAVPQALELLGISRGL